MYMYKKRATFPMNSYGKNFELNYTQMWLAAYLVYYPFKPYLG